MAGMGNITIKNQIDGTPIAIREGYADEPEGERYVQPVELANMRHNMASNAPIRIVSASDPTDMTVLPGTAGGILDTALTATEHNIVVATCQITTTNKDRSVTVTPICIDSNNKALCFLSPRRFVGFKPEGAAGALVGGDGYSLSMLQAWNTIGCTRLGFHVFFDNDNVTEVRLFSAVCTGAHIGELAAPVPQLGDWSNEVIGP